MKTEVIQQTIELWRIEPDKARGKPAVNAWSEAGEAVIEAGPFTWRADLPLPLGGSNQAPSPTAMLLGALAGCAVVFIRDTLAPQLGIAVDSVSASASCLTDSRGLLAMDRISPDLQAVSLDVRIDSPDGDEAIARLAAAWQERCPIYLALVKPVLVRLTVTRAE